jgi:hypothetical protein
VRRVIHAFIGVVSCEVEVNERRRPARGISGKR